MFWFGSAKHNHLNAILVCISAYKPHRQSFVIEIPDHRKATELLSIIVLK